MQKPIVYLIPALLDGEREREGAKKKKKKKRRKKKKKKKKKIPAYVAGCIKNCQVFFVENERSARRFVKQVCKTYLPEYEMIIDNYQWFTIHKVEEEAVAIFKQKLSGGNNIGIISEAGCPGVLPTRVNCSWLLRRK